MTTSINTPAETGDDPFPVGSLLRVTEAHETTGQKLAAGREFEVYDYWPKPAEPVEDEIDVDCYDGMDDYGSSVLADARYVELVKTPAQMRARRIPTPEEIIKELDCLDDYDGFDVTEADAPHGTSREYAGTSADGLYFAFTLTVSNVYQGDR